MSNTTLLALFLVAWLLVGCTTQTKKSDVVLDRTTQSTDTETDATYEDYKITKERYFNVNL